MRKFETNLPLKETFHILNSMVDKVEYQGSRYVFESPFLHGTLLQGNLQAGLEFRLSRVTLEERVLFIRRKSDVQQWYLDIGIRPGEDGGEAVVGVNFHNRKEASDNEMPPCTLRSCNFQISPQVMTPFYLGKYERLQEIMLSGDPVNVRMPARPGTLEAVQHCLELRIESVLHSRMLHNRVEGLFFGHLAACWDELLAGVESTEGGAS
ncbi:MAG: hypothetical protein AAGA85_01890 [Bacteroidota bacterium]